MIEDPTKRDFKKLLPCIINSEAEWTHDWLIYQHSSIIKDLGIFYLCVFLPSWLQEDCVSFIYCCVTNHQKPWCLKLKIVISFAHRFVIWTSLVRVSLPLLHVASAGASQLGAGESIDTSKMAYSHGWQFGTVFPPGCLAGSFLCGPLLSFLIAWQLGLKSKCPKRDEVEVLFLNNVGPETGRRFCHILLFKQSKELRFKKRRHNSTSWWEE